MHSVVTGPGINHELGIMYNNDEAKFNLAKLRAENKKLRDKNKKLRDDLKRLADKRNTEAKLRAENKKLRQRMKQLAQLSGPKSVLQSDPRQLLEQRCGVDANSLHVHEYPCQRTNVEKVEDRFPKFLSASVIHQHLAYHASTSVVPYYFSWYSDTRNGRGFTVTGRGNDVQWSSLNILERYRDVDTLWSALAGMHAVHITHGDIKAENVVRYGGHLRFIDFDNSRLLDEKMRQRLPATNLLSDDIRQTTYLSPECILGHVKQEGLGTFGHDVFTLALLSFWILAGRETASATLTRFRSNEGLTQEADIQHHLGVLIQGTNMDLQLKRVLGQGLAIDPSRRCSAKEISAQFHVRDEFLNNFYVLIY